MVMPLVHAACLCLALASGEPRPLKDVIAELGSADFATRNQAEALLNPTGDYSLAELERSLKNESLTPEQRIRLDRVAYRRFAETPRGALGVSLNETDGGAGRLGVQVTNIRPGFPALGVLKEGDIIVRVDGEGLGVVPAGGVPANMAGLGGGGVGTAALRTFIISHDPGDLVPVTVVRRQAGADGAPAASTDVELKVPLGDFKNLNTIPAAGQPGMIIGSVDLYEPELRAAWEQRVRRITGVKEPAPINATRLRATGPSLQREATWINGRVVDVMDAQARDLAEMGESPSVVPGALPDARRLEDPVALLKGGSVKTFGGGVAWGVPGVDAGMDLSRMTDTDLNNTRRRLAGWIVAMADQQGMQGGRRRASGFDTDSLMRQYRQIERELERRAAEKRDPKP